MSADIEHRTKVLAETLNKITDPADQETRKTVLRAIQKKDPTARFPELEAEDLRSEITQKFEEMEHNRRAQEAQTRLEMQRQSLISEGYSEEDVRKIETDVMEKHGISDYSIAAKVYKADMPAPQPTYDIRGKRPWKAESLKDFMENPKDKAREVAQEVIHEMRSSPNRRTA